MKQQKRNHGQGLDTDREVRHLENIYNEEDDGADDYRLKPTRKRGILRFLTILGFILLILAGVAYLGAYLFGKYAPDNLKQVVGDYGDVNLTISAPEKLNSGDEVTYVITYTNQKKVALKNISLNLRYPSGLMVESVNPAPVVKQGTGSADINAVVQEDNWQLADLAKGQSGQVEVKGRLIAEAGSSQTMFAVMYYMPENFSSNFQKEGTISTLIESTPLGLTVDGPEQLATSDGLSFNVNYKNNSDKDYSNVLLEVSYPDSFQTSSVDPKAKDNNNDQWQMASLKKGDGGVIKINGKFSANVAGQEDFILKASISEDGQKYYLLSEYTYSVNVISGILATELDINGATTDGAVNFGDTLKYSLTFENSSNQTLSNLEVSVLFTPSAEFIDWPSLYDRYDGTLAEPTPGSPAKMLTWTSKEVPNLATLKPGDKGVIDFTLKLSSSSGTLSGDLSLQSIGSIKVGKMGDKDVNIENQSNKITTTINSNLNLSATGLYFDNTGQALGSGPIPPRVAETTSYVINWQLANSVHEVRNISVTTTLPVGVTWLGQKNVTVGSIDYQAASRQITWTVNRMPLDLNLNYTASFGVSITPGSGDVGKVLALTGDNSLSATDSVTNSAINLGVGAVTTDLTNDPLAKGKGLVTQVIQ